MSEQNHPKLPRTLKGVTAIASYCGPGISHHRVRTAIHAGELPIVSSGLGAHVVLRDEVDAWIQRLSRPLTALAG